ncbi:MAG: sigma 54-interacting transcriptional regulator [Kofleriaceae bacterium]|nr:sigma 54-interacting transcriptional regulator [Kofleriaceae bacterium]
MTDDVTAATDQLDRHAPYSDRVLLVIDGAALQVVPLPRSGLLEIGRSSSCDVVVDSGTVSRHHAEIELKPDRVSLMDVGSSNGTTVDGRRLQPKTPIDIAVGTPFLIGSVTMMVQHRNHERREPATQTSQLAALEQSAKRIAVGKLPVLVVGETGVGKERFAERIHELSPRRPSSFIRINCSAVSEAQLESELFGNDAAGKPGLLEAADGGTALLTDIEQLTPALQQKLLRVIEEGAVHRTGGTRMRAVDVRFIATTSTDLTAEVEAGRFRRELYFRIAGATFVVPPLRDRKDEVIPLAEQFIASASGPLGLRFAFSEDARNWLTNHSWPGNIRELRNACERAVLLSTGPTLELHHLTITSDENLLRKPQEQRFRRAQTLPGTFSAVAPNAADMPSQVRATVAELEKQRILEALDRCAGNQTRAAELLGISRRTLINRLDEYGIARPRKRDE